MPFEGLQLGRYRLIRLVGRGAAGEVYLAEDQRITRQVAVKVVQCEDPNDENAKDAARLFQREVRTIAMLNHPNILPLFDFGEDVINGILLTYLVTQYCAEGSLAAWLRQHNRTLILPPHEIAHIMQVAAHALEYAHDKQIIHRDVKPSNFLVRSRKDTPGRPDLLLADFGVARLTNATANISKTVRGTPVYMAPEQWAGDVVPATDQYALAVMAYEMLTGRPPFTGTQHQVMYHHIMMQPQPPSTLNPRVTPAIDAVILRALAKAPEDRFPTISDFARAFQGAIHDSPSTPIISTPSYSPYSNAFMTPPVQFSTPSAESSTPRFSDPGIIIPEVITPSEAPGREIRATLNISVTEAMAGVSRTVMIPDKQPVKVVVPAGAYDGQVLRILEQAASSAPGSQRETILVTLAVTPSTEPPIIEQIPELSPSRIKWRPIGLIALVILVILGSIVGIFSFRSSQSATYLANVTATAGNATALASQSTAAASTASASANATATARLTATASITANPYDSGRWALAPGATLGANTAFQWDEASGSCFFATGGYHVKGTGQPQACVARNNGFGNVTFQVQVTIANGQGGGILLRSTGSAAYYFRISQDGTYMLLGCTGETSCNSPLRGGFSSAITSGLNNPNLLAVVAKGSRIDVYVNNELVNSVNDTASAHGQIGVVAEAGSEVIFNNATVWTS